MANPWTASVRARSTWTYAPATNAFICSVPTAAAAIASGLVLFGEDSGMLEAVDAGHGRPLWQFQTNQLRKASPMTYSLDGNNMWV